MERTISIEERIRRAEEIYNRRNGENINTSNTKKYKNRKSITKRLFMQIFICSIIYLSFYVFTNSDYIFSEEFLNNVKNSFNQNSKIYDIYLNIKTFINNNVTTNNDKSINNQVENEQLEETKNDIKQGESIGGAEETKENITIEENSNKEINKAKTEMEKDAENIKKKIKFVIPVNGRISSTFGWRNPTTSTVPKYHTGLDIAANEGTVIKSATDGKVILVSSEGDYGKHYKIQNGDVIIIYAHCSKLYLKEGNKVKKGDKIAEVGSTGNSTGPHLHFEIRVEDRLVDPQLILDI